MVVSGQWMLPLWNSSCSFGGTGSRSGALERTRFAPSISRQHSGAVTLRRAARKGLLCIISQQTGDSSGCSRSEICLAVLEGIQEAISGDRSHPLDGRCSRLSRKCTPYVHACREPLPLPVSVHAGKFSNVRTMPFNVSCPVRRRRRGETLKERESGLPQPGLRELDLHLRP